MLFRSKLSQYGQLQSQLMGQWLKLNLHELDLAIVSSARRTQQPFTGLGLDIEMISEDRAYNTGSGSLEALIQQLGEGHEDVMILAHNPDVSELAHRAGYGQSMSPCECVVLEFEGPMSEFNPESAHVLLWHQSRP